MALEYNLSLNGKVETFDIIREFGMLPTPGENNLTEDGLFSIDLFDTHGFILSGYFRSDKYFEYPLNREIIVDEYLLSSELIFRLNKGFDNIQLKLNMIELVVFILEKSSEDCRLMFSSDALVLERTPIGVMLNNDFGFWDHLSIDDFFKNTGLNVIRA